MNASERSGKSSGEPLFKWETLQEVGRHDLQQQGRIVRGQTCAIELTSGQMIRVWRAEDGKQYFCHGLTFGGKEAPGGPISPYTGNPVETVLESHYQMIAEAEADAGDILVWRGPAPETTPHSAILIAVATVPSRSYLDESATQLQTKNGLAPEIIVSLEYLIGIYGESYNAYRRK